MRCGGARSSLSVIVVPSRQVRAIKSPVTLLSRHFSSPKPHSHAAHKSAEHASVPSKRDMSRSNNIVAAGLVVWVATIYYYSIQKIKGSVSESYRRNISQINFILSLFL